MLVKGSFHTKETAAGGGVEENAVRRDGSLYDDGFFGVN